MLDAIRIIEGDLTEQTVDAIVNAANQTLLGGGGVDGAIHRAAGPRLLEECRGLGGCETGEAKMTRGYDMPARWVIHTVGPVWRGGEHGEDDLLARCYRNALALAGQRGLKSIAFPSISTGAYGFPIERAAIIALRETTHALIDHPGSLERVVFVCYGHADFERYQEAAACLEDIGV
jgi:O-acetyl-ADP-ribose deacetylase (regulator of RNase III)